MKAFFMVLSLVFLSSLSGGLFAEEAAAENTAAVSNAENNVSAVSSDETAKPDSPEVQAQPLKEQTQTSVQPEQKSTDDQSEIIDEQGYNMKLRSLEEKINFLKDKIFRSKQRLAILQETVLSGTIAGSSVTIVHKNAVGSLFKLRSVVYYFDDATVFKKIDSPSELERNEFVVYDSPVIPGPHHVSAYYVFTGKGYGLFSYMKGYSFKIKAGYSFNVEEGNLVEIVASPMDRGGTYKLDNRLYVSFAMDAKLFEGKKSAEIKDSDTKEE